MMDWDQLQQQWQAEAGPTPMPESAADILRADAQMREKLVRRDRIETIAAVALALVFALFAVVDVFASHWLSAAGHAGLALWAAWVPHRLRRSRKEGAAPPADAPLREHLLRSRDAALAQARMLERAWLWYVLPCVAGLAVTTLADSGPTPLALGYLALVVVAGVAVAWWNRRAARTRMRSHADALLRQLQALDE